MKIKSIQSWQEEIELKEPFSISFSTEDAVTLHFVKLESSSGLQGFGSAKPSFHVTGENSESCKEALQNKAQEILEHEDFRHLPRLIRKLEVALPRNPAARAALDMALHDLLAKSMDLPLVELLGRCHSIMPTSITIGIKDIDETLEANFKLILNMNKLSRSDICYSQPYNLQSLSNYDIKSIL